MNLFFSKYKIQASILLISTCCVFSVLGFSKIDVNIVNYILFSLCFFSLLAINLIKPFSEFFILFNSFLFLGFWCKASIYIVTSRLRGDFFGKFSLKIFNDSILIAAQGAFFLLMLQLILKRKSVYKWIKPVVTQSPFPPFYNILFFIFIIIITYLNYYFRYFQVGLTPTIKLMFPFSLLIFWLLGPGFSFVIFLITDKKFSLITTSTIALSMMAVSISTISRNAMMYFAYPIFAQFVMQVKVLKRSIILNALAMLVVFIFSLFFITQVRGFSYESLTLNHSNKFFNQKINWKYTTESVTQVFLDRWIGLEGILVAKMHESDLNLKKLFFEDSKINRTSLYSNLSESFYPTTGKYLFYTFPGPIGFFAFATSTYLKIATWLSYLLILAASFALIEIFFLGASKSVVSWWAASFLSQISLFPIYNLKIYIVYLTIMVLCALMLKKNSALA